MSHGSALPEKKFCNVNGRRLAYVEVLADGSGKVRVSDARGTVRVP